MGRLLVVGYAGLVGALAASVGLLSRRLARERAATQSGHNQAARLEELGRLRADFIRTVSHDLQTPFTAMQAGLGMVETSLSDRIRPDERRILGNVRRNIDRLGILINDLVAFNQFEAGEMRLDRAPLDLRAVATDALEAVHPLMQEKGQTLEVDLPEPLPYHGDARRLEQVLVSLLDNAHRHTPPGTRIQLSGRAPEGEIRLVVSDDGPGIPADEREAVFERFHRVASAEGGSGLGLAIARAIVEMHGGCIRLESRPGAGAAFHVALPSRPREESE